jgi:hypothetical protein
LVGGSSALDGKVALNKGIVQMAGTASVLDVERLRKIAEVSVAFRTTLIRHEQVLLVQAQQSAACNASHDVEARLARWLLRCRDLSGVDVLELTQEFLAQMLGVGRQRVALCRKNTATGWITWTIIWTGSGVRTMPRYFFHLHGSGASDSDGQEFPNDEAAREEAVVVARELSRNRQVSANERLVVTNAKGEVIHEEPLRGS